MNNIKTFLITAVAFLTALNPLHAIPNQVGGIGFMNRVGMRFENFAVQSKTWKAAGKLPGDWESWQDPKIQDRSILLYRLNMNADVFGIRASQVTAQLKNGQIIQFDILFGASSNSSTSLINQVRTNIQSFTGNNESAGKQSFTHKAVNFQIKENPNRSVIVTISPLVKTLASR